MASIDERLGPLRVDVIVLALLVATGFAATRDEIESASTKQDLTGRYGDFNDENISSRRA